MKGPGQVASTCTLVQTKPWWYSTTLRLTFKDLQQFYANPVPGVLVSKVLPVRVFEKILVHTILLADYVKLKTLQVIGSERDSSSE